MFSQIFNFFNFFLLNVLMHIQCHIGRIAVIILIYRLQICFHRCQLSHFRTSNRIVSSYCSSSPVSPVQDWPCISSIVIWHTVSPTVSKNTSPAVTLFRFAAIKVRGFEIMTYSRPFNFAVSYQNYFTVSNTNVVFSYTN